MKRSVLIFLVGMLLISCFNPEPRRPVVRKTGLFMEKSVSFNKKINEIEENNFKEIIRLDSLNIYIPSSLGFWYTILSKSDQNYFPKPEDKVVYTYEVFDLNNSKIYSENEIGLKEYVVDKQDIVEGLRDGLKLMNEGDVVKFLFPSYKMYGYLGDSHKIDINQSLIYKVKLIKINRKK